MTTHPNTRESARTAAAVVAARAYALREGAGAALRSCSGAPTSNPSSGGGLAQGRAVIDARVPGKDRRPNQI